MRCNDFCSSACNCGEPDDEYMLTQATDEEFNAWIGCPHDAGSYQDAGPLTGKFNTRCSKCHSVISKPG